jgi:hypothetical protein
MSKGGVTFRIVNVANIFLVGVSEWLIYLIQTRQAAEGIGTIAFWFIPSLIVTPWAISVLLRRDLVRTAQSMGESRLLDLSLWKISLLCLVTTTAIFICLTSFFTVPSAACRK